MMLIAGLGNPGRKYRCSPHNMGYEVIQLLARTHHINLKASRKRLAEIGEGDIGGTSVILMKPTTFMNMSGEAVAEYLRYVELDSTKDLLIVADDINLSMGKIRLREKGSHGGHNGLRSIIERLNSSEFPRLRIGIYPRVGEVYDTTTYVLTPLWGDEKELMERVVETAVEAVECVVTGGITVAMNMYNKRVIELP